jgi:hypothetical protein
MLEHPPEHVARQQAHVFGENAENEAVDEMRNGFRVVPAFPESLREGGEAARRLLGQPLARLARAQPFGVEEGRGEEIACRAVCQVLDVEGMHLLDGVGPVGVDPEPRHVRHGQERRVLERDGVLLQLGKGPVEVLLRTFVLPREAFAAPDVGPAFTAGRLAGTLLEGKPFAFRVGGDRIGDAEQGAEVVEVRLRGGALLELDAAPLGDEVVRLHLTRAFMNIPPRAGAERPG